VLRDQNVKLTNNSCLSRVSSLGCGTQWRWWRIRIFISALASPSTTPELAVRF